MRAPNPVAHTGFGAYYFALNGIGPASGAAAMYKLAYAAVKESPRKVIHVVRVLDELLEDHELGEIADEVRERALTRHGEADAAVVMVQGESKETLRLLGDPYAVNRVRAAMFNAALTWRSFSLDSAGWVSPS